MQVPNTATGLWRRSCDAINALGLSRENPRLRQPRNVTARALDIEHSVVQPGCLDTRPEIVLFQDSFQVHIHLPSLPEELTARHLHH